jgi:hypothetical protein
MVMVLETVELLDGLVVDTECGVVSSGVSLTVTVTAGEVV